jgi:hypothetical protein
MNTMTTTDITTAERVIYLKSHAAMKIEKATQSREDAITRMTNYTDSFAIEKLIAADAELHVWMNVQGILNQDTDYADNTIDDEYRLRNLERSTAQRALSTHKINSTSNISVEMETTQRLEWVEAYNLITTGSIWR